MVEVPHSIPLANDMFARRVLLIIRLSSEFESGSLQSKVEYAISMQRAGYSANDMHNEV